MPFCAQCGTQFEGNFCPACGTKVGGSAPPGGFAPNPNSPFDSPAGGPAGAAPPLEEHIASALCYILWPLTGVMFMVLEPYSSNRTVRFHAYQSAFSFVAFFVGFAILEFFGNIPLIGLLFKFVLFFYIPAWFCIVLFMAFKAYNKERFVLRSSGTSLPTTPRSRSGEVQVSTRCAFYH